VFLKETQPAKQVVLPQIVLFTELFAVESQRISDQWSTRGKVSRGRNPGGCRGECQRRQTWRGEERVQKWPGESRDGRCGRS